MPNTAKIRIGGVDYTVQKFDLDQIEQMIEMSLEMNAAGKGHKIAFNVLREAMKTATPPLEDGKIVFEDRDEMQAAFTDAMKAAGLASGEALPQGSGADTISAGPMIPASVSEA